MQLIQDILRRPRDAAGPRRILRVSLTDCFAEPVRVLS
jgi:hypothetical protein